MTQRDRSQYWDGVHVCRPAGQEPGKPWRVVMSPDGDAFTDCIDCAERWPERVITLAPVCFSWVSRPTTVRCDHRGGT